MIKRITSLLLVLSLTLTGLAQKSKSVSTQSVSYFGIGRYDTVKHQIDSVTMLPANLLVMIDGKDFFIYDAAGSHYVLEQFVDSFTNKNGHFIGFQAINVKTTEQVTITLGDLANGDSFIYIVFVKSLVTLAYKLKDEKDPTNFNN